MANPQSKGFTAILNLRITKALYSRLRMAARQEDRTLPDYLRVQLERLTKDAISDATGRTGEV